MVFDKNLDKNKWSDTKEFETTRISVGVFSYNEGEKKIQISRENRNQDGEWSFAKLGRLFQDEAEFVAEAIKKALEQI